MEATICVLTIITSVLGTGLTLWSIYYFITGLMSLKKTENYPQVPASTRFAVLVAARNEQQVIGSLVESLREQAYPKELYDIWVIPNQCSDDTAAVARAAGAKVLECTVPVKSKGDVMEFAYEKLSVLGYDAYCVFDADNVAEEHFLMEMNNAYQSGVRVAQGYRDSKNPYDTGMSGSYSIYYWMMNRFHNQGKAAMGLSAMLNGTGFMVASSVFEQLGGWHTKTISEDLELSALCTLAGEKIYWVPKAITYDEQPLTYEVSVKQRKRWTSGTLQVVEHYLGQLFGRGDGASLDLIATMLIPTYQVLAVVNLFLSVLLCGMVIGGRFAVLVGVGVLLCNLAFTLFLSLCSGIGVLLLEKKWNRNLWKGLVMYGLFLLSWIPITIGCHIKKTTVWEEIRHTCTMTTKKRTIAVRY